MKLVFALVAFATLGVAHPLKYDVAIVSRNTTQRRFVPTALADDGTVVGYEGSDTERGSYRAATWRDGQLRRFEGYGYRSAAYATNASGQIAGHAELEAGSELYRPAFWDKDGTFHPLEGFGTSGYVEALTDGGTVLGSVQAPNARSFIWDKGRVTYIPFVHERSFYSFPTDINNRGIAIGLDSDRENGSQYPWIWSKATGVNALPFGPIDINDRDVILGTTITRSPIPLLYSLATGEVRYMKASRPGVPIAMNDHEQVVGRDTRKGSSSDAAILWRDPRSAPVRLEELIDPNLGLWITRPFAINNAGQILAWAMTPDRQNFYTVRLDPRNRIPGPTALRASAFGLVHSTP